MTEYVGAGIYSVSEASKLTHVSRQRIQRWLHGYTYTHKNQMKVSPSVWAPHFPMIGGTYALSFRDLLEVRFVDAFRKHRVGWKTLRRAADAAMSLYKSSHPFSTQRFRTDGNTIFADLATETNEKVLLDLARSQLAFSEVLSPYLYEGLEFRNDNVVRWWPLGTNRSVVIDPGLSFGQPVIKQRAIPTASLYNAFKANKKQRAKETIEFVAAWYEVEVSAVQDAIDFERKISA